MEFLFELLFWLTVIIGSIMFIVKGIKAFKKNFIFYCKPPEMSSKAHLFRNLK